MEALRRCRLEHRRLRTWFVSEAVAIVVVASQVVDEYRMSLTNRR